MGLVGRKAELASIRDAFARGSRVVTLVGLGGIGKTRIARAFVEETEAAFVDLAGSRTRADVCAAVAGVLDVRADESPSSLERRVGDRARGRSIVLDNFEQIEANASSLVRDWDAHFLVTSRRPLEVEGEIVIAIEPLDVPTDAVELFLDRARGRTHPANDPALVERIVRHLEGIPLAIELAAARLDVLPLATVSKRLEERFALLRDPISPSTRHGTIERSLEWSWDLLEPTQRTMFAELGTFEGAFTLEDAEAILGSNALDAIHALARHSLVRSLPSGDFEMLDTVREFAASKITTDAYERHAKLFLERGLAKVRAIDERGSAPDIERDRNDLVAIFRRSDPERKARALVALGPILALRTSANERLVLFDEIESSDPETKMRLVHQRAWTLRECGRVEEALALLTRALEDAPSAFRAMLLEEASACEVVHGRPDRARDRAKEAIEASKDKRREGRAHFRHAIADADLGDFESGRAHGTRALEMFRALGDEIDETLALASLGACAFEQGDLESARRFMESAVEIARACGERKQEAVALGYLGGIAHEKEDFDAAKSAYECARLAFERIGERRLEAIYAGYVGIVETQNGGDGTQAISNARDILHAMDDVRYVAAMDAALVGARVLRGETKGAREELARIRATVHGRGNPHLLDLALVYEGLVDAVEGNIDRAEECLRRHARAPIEDVRLALPFLRRVIREARAWSFDPRGIAFAPPSSPLVRLDTREPLARIVAALVRERIDHPGRAIDKEDLIRAAWPDESRLSAESANNRLKVAINTLRKAGLVPVLVTRGRGYLLDPEMPVRWI